MSDENIYNEIADENSDQSLEKEVAPKGNEELEDSERVVEEKDLKTLGLSKSFLGKPYYDTIVAQNRELQKWNTKLSQDVSSLNKKYEELNVKLTAKEVKEVKEIVEEKLPDIPDPLEYPKEFSEWFVKRDELTRKELRKEFEEKLKSQDGIKDKVGALEAKENQSVLWDTVSNNLKELYGDDFTPDMVEPILKEYEDFLLEQDEEDQQIVVDRFTGKPTKLAAEIIRFHKAQNFGKTKEKKKEETHEEKVQRLKNKNKTFINSASSPRDKVKTQEEPSAYQDLIADAETRLSEELSQ